MSPLTSPKTLAVAMVFTLLSETSRAQSATILETENIVQTSAGGKGWADASANQSLAVGDRIRTRQRSRAESRTSSSSTSARVS